jgi:hypothetical protein
MSEIVAELEPNTVSNLPNSTVPSTKAYVWTTPPRSALLMAIVAPDIYTAREDRDQAIVLRWALRDIKGERLKWSPVNQQALKILNDALTPAFEHWSVIPHFDQSQIDQSLQPATSPVKSRIGGRRRRVQPTKTAEAWRAIAKVQRTPKRSNPAAASIAKRAFRQTASPRMTGAAPSLCPPRFTDKQR